MTVLTSRFDTRILLQTNTPTKNNMYEVSEDWDDYRYTYATVVNKNQSSTIEGGEVFFDTFEFYIRYIPAVNGNFRVFRIYYEGQYYRIVGKVVVERNKVLKLQCTMYDNE